MSTTRVATEVWRLDELIALYASPFMRDVPLVLYRDVPIERDWRGPKQHADFHSLYIAERGRGVHVIDSRSYAISRGDVYVMGAGSDHRFTDWEGLALNAIHFSPDLFDPATWLGLTAVPGFDTLVLDRPAHRRLHLDPAAYAEVARDLAALRSEWTNGTPADAIRVRSEFMTLILRLARYAAGEPSPLLQPSGVNQSHEELVASAVRTIDLHYGRRLRVAELAASVHLSADHFTAIFSGVIGMTPREYLWHVRLERAKTLLATTVMPIAEIARATGITDHTSFTRRFRAATGVSPREFRRSGAATSVPEWPA